MRIAEWKGQRDQRAERQRSALRPFDGLRVSGGGKDKRSEVSGQWSVVSRQQAGKQDREQKSEVRDQRSEAALRLAQGER